MTEQHDLPFNSPSLHNFIYYRSPYHGNFEPEYLVFNANLQEFSPEEAYYQIKSLWKHLKHTKKQLNFKQTT
jgi:hypothetical protein